VNLSIVGPAVRIDDLGMSQVERIVSRALEAGLSEIEISRRPGGFVPRAPAYDIEIRLPQGDSVAMSVAAMLAVVALVLGVTPEELVREWRQTHGFTGLVSPEQALSDADQAQT
jgi:hypothetical protein